ncbi:MAG: DUF2920 family protein [Candidatus Algichlamydia australiensis]|nr:DUF2920 family protein [Chlamydiales bacterium]
MNIFTDIAKEELCRTPDFISAKISPDGKLIAKIGADEFGIPNVTVSPIDEAGAASPCLSSFKTPEIIQFFWSADSKKVLLLKDEEGKGQLHLHGFDVETKEHTPYTKQFSQVNTKVIKLSSTENVAVVGLNHRNPHFHDLYKLNLDSGQFSLLLENDTFANFLFSDDLEAFLKIKIHEDGSWTAYLDDDTVFLNLTAEEAFETKFLSYNNQEKRVHFLDNRFSNTNQLTQKSVEAPYEEKVLGGQKFSDVDEVIFFQGKPKAYASYYTQKKWHTIDSKIQQDIDFLIEKVGSNFTLVSLNQEASIWIVSNSIPDKGNYFWIFQRDSHKLTQISPSTSCEPKDYSKMYEMVVTARDGKQLVCYYTIPREYDRGGYLDTPLPLVVIPHGGPFKVRDKFEFNPYHQWLASCGYAALSVNFRLSSGFGKEFVNAGNGEWGGKAHLDVIDAVEACIEKGLTERGRQAVFGGSYGGYESLAALTFTPKYFNCCVAICGPSNLKTVLKSTPEFWEFTSKPLSDETMFFTRRAFVTSMGGDPNDEEGAKYLEKCSPLHHLNEIQSPLLLVHGKNDHVVTENESRQIYDSMKKNNKDVTYIFFPNEGHRFANYANNLMYLDQAEQFLSQHLGGKYRPAERSLLADSTGEVFS